VNKNPIDNGFRKDNYCPYCFVKLNAASAPEDLSYVPSPGDFSVCIQCHHALQFDDDMVLKKFDMNELDLEDAREIHKIQSILMSAKKE
jgi:hypothetical protein